jgi:hypothetical protein
LATEPLVAEEPEAEAEHEEPEAEVEHELDLEPIDLPHVHEADEAVEDTEAEEAEEEHRPSMTTQREAAAELTATSRAVAEPVVAEPAPEPEPAPVASAPVPMTPEPTRVAPSVAGDGAAAPTALPAGTRRWDRSDDDILPEKQGKKFFSFSLRRG